MIDEWIQTAIIIGLLLAATFSFIWVAVKLPGVSGSRTSSPSEENQPPADYTQAAHEDVERIFNDEFREELRNRGRLHFEKIIGENAMFLQQDLRLTTSQINEYMKEEITGSLKEAFRKYEESIKDAEKLALDSIEKTQVAVEQQREILNQQLVKEISAEKEKTMNRFNNNMADIVNHYVLASIGSQISLDDQLEYILNELEHNKQAIIEDIKIGA